MIKLQIVGHLGKDCIIKEVNGKTVINFSVAHSERFKDSQGVQKERTTWVECAYWSDKTVLGQYLKKGQLVYAEGSPEADGYMNKDNQPAATLRMRVQNVQLLGSSNKDGQGSNAGNVSNTGLSKGPVATTESSNAPAATPAVVDDLPF
ncbi:MAG TPA: single-stranded DNA-binding protein [Ferruginibacter sp.]|nr:single-stranded DNA-binding protein [Ferruginibacter sp.]